jgi:hypothetical protein
MRKSLREIYISRSMTASLGSFFASFSSSNALNYGDSPGMIRAPSVIDKAAVPVYVAFMAGDSWKTIVHYSMIPMHRLIDDSGVRQQTAGTFQDSIMISILSAPGGFCDEGTFFISLNSVVGPCDYGKSVHA